MAKITEQTDKGIRILEGTAWELKELISSASFISSLPLEVKRKKEEKEEKEEQEEHEEQEEQEENHSQQTQSQQKIVDRQFSALTPSADKKKKLSLLRRIFKSKKAEKKEGADYLSKVKNERRLIENEKY